jgi:hypothetical protein
VQQQWQAEGDSDDDDAGQFRVLDHEAAGDFHHEAAGDLDLTCDHDHDRVPEHRLEQRANHARLAGLGVSHRDRGGE